MSQPDPLMYRARAPTAMPTAAKAKPKSKTPVSTRGAARRTSSPARPTPGRLKPNPCNARHAHHSRTSRTSPNKSTIHP